MTDLFSLEPGNVVYLAEGQSQAYELLTDRLSFTVPTTLCNDPNGVAFMVDDLNRTLAVLTAEQREALITLYHRTYMLLGNSGINSPVTIEVLQRLLAETWSSAQLADSVAAIATRTLAFGPSSIDHARTIALYFRLMLPLTAKMVAIGGTSAVAGLLGIHERVMTEVFVDAWDGVLGLARDAIGAAEAHHSTDMLTVLLRNLLTALSTCPPPEHLEDVTRFLAEHVRLHTLMDSVLGSHRTVSQSFYHRTARVMTQEPDGAWSVYQLDSKAVTWAGSAGVGAATATHAVAALLATEQCAPSTQPHPTRGTSTAPFVMVARPSHTTATIVHNLTPGRTRGFLNLRGVAVEGETPSVLEATLEAELMTLLQPFSD